VETFSVVLKSIALVKKELEIMKVGKCVMIENSIDNAVFRHELEKVIPITEYKLVRQDDKDILILD